MTLKRIICLRSEFTGVHYIIRLSLLHNILYTHIVYYYIYIYIVPIQSYRRGRGCFYLLNVFAFYDSVSLYTYNNIIYNICADTIDLYNDIMTDKRNTILYAYISNRLNVKNKTQ